MSTQTEIETLTSGAALLGVEFTLKTLGVDSEGLLGKFVKQEFQAWIADYKERTRAAAERAQKASQKPWKGLRYDGTGKPLRRPEVRPLRKKRRKPPNTQWG